MFHQKLATLTNNLEYQFYRRTFNGSYISGVDNAIVEIDQRIQ